jgi:BASS family bile acid:Na+ symporter
MNLAHLIPLVLQISIGLIVACIAMQARPGDLTYLLRRPSLLLRSLLAMSVVTPIMAVVVAASFNLDRGLEVALILLAVSPVPPILPGKEGKAGGNVSYAIGLLAITALAAIVTVPVSMALIGRFFGRDVHVSMALIAKVVAMSVIVPLAVGAIVGRLAPKFAARFAKPISTTATLLLVLAAIPILVGSWHAIVGATGNLTLAAIVLFVLGSLLVGHLLGGPDHDDRTVLGLSTASRHPGVAMAIAAAIASPENKPGISAAILLTFIAGIVVTSPYVKWRRRTQVAVPAPAV